MEQIQRTPQERLSPDEKGSPSEKEKIMDHALTQALHYITSNKCPWLNFTELDEHIDYFSDPLPDDEKKGRKVLLVGVVRRGHKGLQRHRVEFILNRNNSVLLRNYDNPSKRYMVWNSIEQFQKDIEKKEPPKALNYNPEVLPLRPTNFRQINSGESYKLEARGTKVEYEWSTTNEGESADTARAYTPKAVRINGKVAFRDLDGLRVEPVPLDGGRPKSATARGIDGCEYLIQYFHDGTVAAIYRVQP